MSEKFRYELPHSWSFHMLRTFLGSQRKRIYIDVHTRLNLPESMKQEAFLFFQNLIEQDGPIGDFLTCDYAYVDKRLATLYKLPAKDTLRLADGFQRVNVAGDSHRGGLLGMAAVLTVSANGVETSPVTRGVWVSENILGAAYYPDLSLIHI